MTLEQKIAIALPITAKFEGGGYGTVAGNFDGMGLSCGALQWNAGSGTLQSKILIPYLQAHGSGSIDTSKIFPAPIGPMCVMTRANAVAYCKAIMHDASGVKLKPEWKAAWQKFMLLPAVVQLQIKAATQIGLEAEKQCLAFALTSIRGFAWAFDIEVQNHSMDGVGLAKPDRVEAKKIIMGRTDQTRDLWLSALPTLSNEQVSLFVTSYRRALTANQRWFHAVFNRKAAIAIGVGYVNGAVVKLPQLEAAAAKAA